MLRPSHQLLRHTVDIRHVLLGKLDSLDELHVPVRYPEVLDAALPRSHDGALCVG